MRRCTVRHLAVLTAAQAPAPLCVPATGPVQTVVSVAQRNGAAANAQPPLIDVFAWPDGPFGVLRTPTGEAFFATDGGGHRNGKGGSITLTFGDLANPLGPGSAKDAPIDVTIQSNSSVNPNYAAYSYAGGGPVYLVPQGLPGAGNLLSVYHAERTTTGAGGFYSLLGLASSRDGGHSWHDLGEIVEANQPFRSDLQGYDIGISQLVTDPTARYFYVYFPDWIANGSVTPSTETVMSVARVAIEPLLAAAFAPTPHALPPFEKFYDGGWTQPGINGLSSDLEPGSQSGAPSVTYDGYLKRFVVIGDDTTNVSYGESPDGVQWTARRVVLTQASSLYARAVGTGGDPNVLGPRFEVYYTFRPDWTSATVRRFELRCGPGATGREPRSRAAPHVPFGAPR